MSTKAELRRYYEVAAKKVENDIYFLTEDARYEFDESLYDERLKTEGSVQHIIKMSNHKRAFYGQFKIPEPVIIQEIGCGTGVHTCALREAIAHDLFIVSDKSSAFLSLTRLRMDSFAEAIGRQSVADDRLLFAVVSAEEDSYVVENSLSAVFMYGVLHHIDAWKDCLVNVFNSLKPGGILSITEPCPELHLVLGTIFKMLLKNKKYRASFSDDEVQKLQSFSNAVIFRLDSSKDKSKTEEKHTFRIDDMLKIAMDHGMTCGVYPHGRKCGTPFNKGAFKQIIINNLSSSGGFTQNCIEKIFKFAGDYIDELAGPFEAGRGPYQYAEYVFQKPIA